MQIDETAIVHACELLRDYHWRNGRKDEANAWHQRAMERAGLQQSAEAERKGITVRDTFEPHGLPEEAVSALVTQLRAVAHVRKAYLVRKRVLHLAHRPYYILGFTATAPFRFYRIKRATEVLQAIHQSVQFPGEALIVNVESVNARFRRRFRKIQGARIV